ncbi:FAR1-related sequence 5-like protein, partial [Tanacetum coccineum]
MDEDEVIDVTKLIDWNKQIVEQENEVESDRDDVLLEVSDPDTVMEEVTDCMKTPRATLYEQNETPGGSIYQLRGPTMIQEGVPKGINVDTLDPEYSDKQKRNTTTHITGMLLHEDTKSYAWLLKAFMTAFLKEPTMIVTYQDGAMKRAIESVLTKAKHRLCMWHIMQRIPSNICKEIYDKTDFKEHFDKIVWNMFIEPLKFEEKWARLIEDFGLQNHKWMTKMFNLREIWIPAYFIDSLLFGLMRTTSRSKSENSFFKSFTSPGATLISFLMSYELAMERQRYRQEALDFKTIDAAPKCDTKLAIERHAARVYTRTIFFLVQMEIIKGCWSCMIQDVKINEGCKTVIIRDKKLNDNRALNTKKGKEQEKKTGTMTEPVSDNK